MRAPSTRRKQTIKRKPGAGATPAAGDIQEEDSVAAAADDGGPAMDGIKCVAGEFQSALDTLFNTLDDAHAWYVFCVNPNDSRLPNQLEDRGVKAQVRSLGLSQMTRKQGVVFEAGMSPQEFCDRYRDYLRYLVSPRMATPLRASVPLERRWNCTSSILLLASSRYNFPIYQRERTY